MTSFPFGSSVREGFASIEKGTHEIAFEPGAAYVSSLPGDLVLRQLETGTRHHLGLSVSSQNPARAC